MSTPTLFKLVVSRDGRRQVGPAMDLERTAKALLELHLEGFEAGDVDLLVGQIGRRATSDEQAQVVGRTAELIETL